MTGLDIRTPFDDDSHTFSDGALERFFRMRKWMFLASVLLVLIDQKWIDYGRLSEMLRLSSLPLTALHLAINYIAVYLLVQAVAVSLQVLVTYRQTMEARVARLKLHQLEDITTTVDVLRKRYDVSAARHNVALQKMRSAAAAADAADLTSKAPRILIRPAQDTARPAEVESRQSDVDVLQAYRLSEAGYKSVHAEFSQIHAQLVAAERSRDSMWRSNNFVSQIVRRTEIFLDVSRLVLPISALSAALIFHGQWWPTHGPSAESVQSSPLQTPPATGPAGPSQSAPEPQIQTPPTSPANPPQ